MILHTFTVPGDQADTRLYALTRRMLPQEPEYRIREAFARRDVKQAGVRVSRDALALPGATVQVYLPENPAATRAPEIVYEDPQLLVVRKPVGVSCETDAKGGLTLAQWLTQANPGRWEQPPKPCHRLDNQTDGLLMLAKNDTAFTAMRQAFHDHLIHKRYICLVKGVPAPREAVLSAYLQKDAANARVTVLDAPAVGVLPIRTGYRVLSSGDPCRVEVELFTGRTHQIRAQMAHIGHPLLGDDRYGDRAYNKAHKARRLMLTAVELRFELTGPYEYLNQVRLSVEPEF